MTDAEILLPIPPRGPYKKGSALDAQCVRLRALGWSIDEIRSHTGITTSSQVAAAIRRGLANTVRFAKDEQRLLELDSMLEIERMLWIQLRSHHTLVSNGRVIRDDMDVPLNDDRFLLEVIDRIMKLKDQRAKLLGLNAPARAEVFTVDSVEAEIFRLEQELRQNRESTGI